MHIRLIIKNWVESLVDDSILGKTLQCHRWMFNTLNSDFERELEAPHVYSVTRDLTAVWWEHYTKKKNITQRESKDDSFSIWQLLFIKSMWVKHTDVTRRSENTKQKAQFPTILLNKSLVGTYKSDTMHICVHIYIFIYIYIKLFQYQKQLERGIQAQSQLGNWNVSVWTLWCCAR